MLSNFRSYQLSVAFFKECSKLKLPAFLKDQLQRAASSTVLNLAEGSARCSNKDKARFYNIAFASNREVQSILDIAPNADPSLAKQADILAACIYKLIKATI